MDAKLYITEIINELTFVKDSIREDDCTKLIDTIQQSQRVFCYGLGRAGFSMKAFTMRLMHMGKEVYFLTETITPNFGPGDLFIVLLLPVRQHNWWRWRKKHVSSAALWRC